MRIALLSWRREKNRVRTGVQHAASTPMPVYVPATAGHVLLCPPLAITTRGPRCHLSSVHVLHASGLWTGMHSNLFVTLPTAMAPVAFAPEAIVVGAPAANVVALAARTLQRTIFPPERTDVRLALFGVEEFVQMGEHRHG